MLPNSGHDVGILCPLLEILQVLDVSVIFLFVCRLCERDGNVLARDPLIEIVFNLYTYYMSRKDKKKDKGLTIVKTSPIVDKDIISSSKNSGWTTPSSFLPRNHVLLISVWMTGARKIPVFCSVFYPWAQNIKIIIYKKKRLNRTCLINIMCFVKKVFNLVTNGVFGSRRIQRIRGDDIGF